MKVKEIKTLVWRETKPHDYCKKHNIDIDDFLDDIHDQGFYFCADCLNIKNDEDLEWLSDSNGDPTRGPYCTKCVGNIKMLNLELSYKELSYLREKLSYAQYIFWRKRYMPRCKKMDEKQTTIEYKRFINGDFLAEAPDDEVSCFLLLEKLWKIEEKLQKEMVGDNKND